MHPLFCRHRQRAAAGETVPQAMLDRGEGRSARLCRGEYAMSKKIQISEIPWPCGAVGCGRPVTKWCPHADCHMTYCEHHGAEHERQSRHTVGPVPPDIPLAQHAPSTRKVRIPANVLKQLVADRNAGRITRDEIRRVLARYEQAAPSETVEEAEKEEKG